ncbi:hypothetical protein D1007_09098 [Hordeum vulgare]|nr:hypothetical protein D1007_09098 [Hordeum vulgare]
MEEALGKLDISEEEVTPLVINDSDDGSLQKWLVAAKIPVQNKRKGGQQSNQVYKPVAKLPLAITEHGEPMACGEGSNGFG